MRGANGPWSRERAPSFVLEMPGNLHCARDAVERICFWRRVGRATLKVLTGGISGLLVALERNAIPEFRGLNDLAWIGGTRTGRRDLVDELSRSGREFHGQEPGSEDLAGG